MLKTNKKIEKEFMDVCNENHGWECVSHSEGQTCCIDSEHSKYKEILAFIHQTRIADLEEMERIITEKLEAPEKDIVMNGDAYIKYGISLALSEILYVIQKVKEEIGK